MITKFSQCECKDLNCPVCKGLCIHWAEITLYRVDMEDEIGTPLCEACAEDAIASGILITREKS